MHILTWMKEEQVILVDKKDNPIGLMHKMEAHEKALLHRAFSVFIFNTKGELLLQRRAATKYHSPKLWTNTVCSHQRQNEENIEAGERRLQEEMGMTTELREIFHFIYKAAFDNGLTEHELDHVMIGFSNSNPKPNPDEVMGYKWEKLNTIQKDIQQHPEQYTEWFKVIFANSYDKLKEALEIRMLQYPLFFKPIFKKKPWGGNKLNQILNKKTKEQHVGESWEISAIQSNYSKVSGGYFANWDLEKLVDTYKERFVGKNIYKKFGSNFPLLIKFIDAADDLSVQVHPNDKIAKEIHQSFGKNELWHIVQANQNAILYLGFKKGTDKNDYLRHLEHGTLEQILNQIPVKTGDTYYIPAGTVHAIGKGILLAEIQQTSDVTYRIFDWNRLGLNGKSRELHTELALKAIRFDAKPEKKSVSDIETPYFKIKKRILTSNLEIDLSKRDSFVIFMNVSNGFFEINDRKIHKGKTVLLPATATKVKIKTIQKGELLEIYL